MALKRICNNCGADITGPYTRVTVETVEDTAEGGMTTLIPVVNEDICSLCSNGGGDADGPGPALAVMLGTGVVPRRLPSPPASSPPAKG